jgi:hypothetical protein
MGKFAAALLSIGCLVSCSSNSSKTPASAPLASSAQKVSTPTPDPTLVPPETVRMEKVVFVNGVKNLTVSNAEGRYALACNSDLDSCVTPTPGKDYLLFTKSTNWKFPGATGYITLEWIQKWSGTYNKEENIALLPAEGDRSNMGMYWLISWNKNK